MFSHFSLEKPLAEKPLDETSDLIFEGVPVTPGPTEREPATVAEGEKNLPGGSQKEEEKAAGQAGQAGVQGDTSRGIEFQAVPSERAEVGQALSPTAREEDCFQILGRPGLPWSPGRREGAPRVSPFSSLRALNSSEPPHPG